MRTWAILAAKHAALTSNFVPAKIPAMTWDTVDGIAVGLFLVGIAFVAFTARRPPNCPLPSRSERPADQRTDDVFEWLFSSAAEWCGDRLDAIVPEPVTAQPSLTTQASLAAPPSPAKPSLEAEPEPDTQPNFAAIPQPDQQPSLDAEPKLEAEPVPETDPGPGADLGPEMEPGSDAVLDPDIEASPVLEASLDMETGPDQEANAEVEASALAEASPEADASPVAEASPEAETGAEAEAADRSGLASASDTDGADNSEQELLFAPRPYVTAGKQRVKVVSFSHWPRPAVRNGGATGPARWPMPTPSESRSGAFARFLAAPVITPASELPVPVRLDADAACAQINDGVQIDDSAQTDDSAQVTDRERIADGERIVVLRPGARAPGYQSKHRLDGSPKYIRPAEGRRPKPRHAAPSPSLGVTLSRCIAHPRLVARYAAHPAA